MRSASKIDAAWLEAAPVESRHGAAPGAQAWRQASWLAIGAIGMVGGVGRWAQHRRGISAWRYFIVGRCGGLLEVKAAERKWRLPEGVDKSVCGGEIIERSHIMASPMLRGAARVGVRLASQLENRRCTNAAARMTAPAADRRLSPRLKLLTPMAAVSDGLQYLGKLVRHYEKCLSSWP